MATESEAMSNNTLIQCLRAADPDAQARLLRSALNDSNGDVDGITTILLDSIAEGRLPPSAIRPWLGVSRSPEAIARAFFQSSSVYTRGIAIKYIRKSFRREDALESTWGALGGAQGLGRHMAKLSIKQQHDLCSALGSLIGADDGIFRKLRQERIAELYDFLMDSSRNTHEGRPVIPVYARLLPACTPETAETYLKTLDPDSEDSPKRQYEKQKLAQTDWEFFEQRAFEDTFSTEGATVVLKRLKMFIDRSQAFRLRVLEALASGNNFNIADKKEFVTDLALPLARHCSKTHRSSRDLEGHHRLWKLLNVCLEDPEMRRLGFHGHGLTLLQHAARSWSYCRGDSESSGNLAKLISILPSSFFSLKTMGYVLGHVAPSLRYACLRIWLANPNDHRLDIGDVDGQGSMSLKSLEFPVGIFTLLSTVDGLKLFERCLDANPDHSFLSKDTGYLTPSFLNQKQEAGSGARPDFHILRAGLIKRADPKKVVLPARPDSIIEDIRSTELERRKKLAKESKQPEIRAFWALSALRMCAALRDFDLLNETLIWARRFNKDPLAVKEIYPRLDMTPFLACGIVTSEEHMYATQDELKQTLLDANRAVGNILETIMLIQNEMSNVKRTLWDNKNAKLAARVAIVRLRKVKKLQSSLQMTDDQVYDVLLRPTLDLLLHSEAVLIDFETVDSCDQAGLICFGSDQIGYNVSPPNTAELMFWEAYARERDQMWEQKRSIKRPEVMTLTAPWPRGLPVQHLIPTELQDSIRVPYATERAKAIVFCDPDIALQPRSVDKVDKKVIGKFVNSYLSALKLWVHAVEKKEDQQTRIMEAWNYALGPLTGDRLSRKEAETFWYHRAFGSAEHFLQVSVHFSTFRHPAAVPSSDDPNMPLEWDPDPSYNQQQESRSHNIGPVLALDCMLWRAGERSLNTDEVSSDPVWTEGFWSSCWRSDTWSRLHTENSRKNATETTNSSIEALIAAAVLTVDAVHGKGSSLLLQPFPSAEDARFPALYLDQDFLERETDRDFMGIYPLQSLRPHIPPCLLAQLASSMLAKVNGETNIKDRRYYKFVVMVETIIQGDNPSLAIPLIEKFVLESHDASSYFRGILSTKLMERLSPEDAAHLYESLTGQILSKLSQQQAKRENMITEDSTTEGQSAPSFKITTVKMLAQLPRQCRALDTRKSLVILSRFIQESSHIDIKSAALKSLRESAVDKDSQAFVNKFFEDWAVNVAGSLDEKSPQTEADWEAAKSGGSLPEVNEERPILDILLTKDSMNAASGYSIPRHALEASQKNNERWMRLFTERYEAAIDTMVTTELPPVPASRLGLLNFLELFVDAKAEADEASCSVKEPRLPLDILDSMRRYVLHLMDPPRWVAAIMAHVKSTAELSTSNSGRHWLDIWENEGLEDAGAKYQEVGGDWACQRLKEFKPQKDASEIQPSDSVVALEDFVFDMAEVCVRKGNVKALYILVDKLRPRWNAVKDPVCEERGPGNVLRRIIAHVEKSRTPEWQADPQRQPPRLPDSITLRTKLLQLPKEDSKNSESVEKKHIVSFVEQVVSLIHSIVNDRVPYESRFGDLRRRVLELSENKILVASLLGNVNMPEPGMAELLRVRLAVSLIKEVQEVEPWKGQDGIACRKMIQGWKQSTCEDLREQAMSIRKEIEDKFPRRAKDWFS